MLQRTLGKDGPLIAPLVLGTDNFANPTPENECRAILLRAIETGINLIDTSNSYAGGESERIIGRTLAGSGLRKNVLLATKVFYPTGPLPDDRGLSKVAIIKACENSLRNLQTDYIDLYQLHRPDFSVAHEETLGALDDLVRQGKVRFIGSSTAPAWRIMEGLMISRTNKWAGFISEQPPYNLLDRRIENETIPLCQQYHLGIITWSPLAMGMLAGRYLDDSNFPADSRAIKRKGIYAERVTPKAILAGNQFVRFALQAGYDPAQLALTWVKEQPGITAAIMGPKSIQQLDHLLPVLEMKISDEIQKSCDELFPPGSAVADFHNTSGWTKKLSV